MDTPEDSKKARRNSHGREFDAAFVPTAGESRGSGFKLVPVIALLLVIEKM